MESRPWDFQAEECSLRCAVDQFNHRRYQRELPSGAQQMQQSQEKSANETYGPEVKDAQYDLKSEKSAFLGSCNMFATMEFFLIALFFSIFRALHCVVMEKLGIVLGLIYIYEINFYHF